MDSSQSSRSERHYTEEEAREVFQRAAARQEAARAAAEAKGTHLTLRELQQIGDEAGINPAFVAAAAVELDRPTAQQDQQNTSFFLGRRHLQLERVLPGSVSTSTWEAMVDELRRTFEKPGIAGQVGSTREWTPSGQSSVRVVVTPEENMTRFAIEQSFKEDALAAPALGIGLALMGMLIGVLFLLGGEIDWAPVLTFLALSPVSFFAVRYGTDLYVGRQERRFGRLLDRLELIALKDSEPVRPRTGTEQQHESQTGELRSDPTSTETSSAPQVRRQRNRS